MSEVPLAPAARSGDGSGLLLMVASSACFALMAAVVKKLLPQAPAQAVVLSRSLLMTLTFVALARWRGVPLVGARPGLLLLRGLLGYGALSCYFFSVQHLPLGDAVLLQYSHPIFVAAIAPLLLHEPTRRGHWPLVLVALLGVGLIVGPSGDLRGEALIGLLGSLFSGLAYLSIRALSRTEAALTILVWFPLASIPGSLVASIAAGRDCLPRDMGEVAGHLLVWLTALVGQVTLTLGLERATAARATAVTMTGPGFGMLLGWLMFATAPSLPSVLGLLAIGLALGVLARGWAR